MEIEPIDKDKLANLVAHIAVTQNRGVFEVLSNAVDNCFPIDRAERDNLYLRTHHALYDMRHELPYYIPKPPPMPPGDE